MTDKEKKILETITEEQWEAIRLLEKEKCASSLEERASKILISMGVSAHLRGYRYLMKAVEMVYDDQTYLEKGITKRLYPDIARQYGKSHKSVERDIRYALELALIDGDADIQKDVLRIDPLVTERIKSSKAIANTVAWLKTH